MNRRTLAERTPATRSIDLILSAFSFFAFIYFHPGGGWNQNARFAQLRAIVETGDFSIDSYLVYQRRSDDEASADLVRIPIERGSIRSGGHDYRLVWTPGTPIDGKSLGEELLLTSVAATGDVAYRDGRFFPNKAPGTTLIGVAPYALLVWCERHLGLDLDDARVLNANLWLVSLMSIAPIAALGLLPFSRLCRDLFGASSAGVVVAAAALAFGTPYFAYGTFLYEHDVVAVALLVAYAAATSATAPGIGTAIAGLLWTFAALSNYVAILAGPVVLWLTWRRERSARTLLSFAAGGIPIVALLALWNLLAYGALWVGHYGGEHPIYRTPGAWLGVFTMPDVGRAIAVFFSPHRGLFASAPILLAAVVGWWRLLRRGERRIEVLAALAITAPYFAFTMFFEHWHGGGAYGPRYLVPTFPFLMLGLPVAWSTMPRSVGALAIISVAINLLAIAVDPQPPVGIHHMATDPRRPTWAQSPIVDYAIPLFFTGRAEPVLEGYRHLRLAEYEQRLEGTAINASDRYALIAEAGRTIDRAIRDRDPAIPIAGVVGPVSANVLGAYESGWFKLFPAGSPVCRFASFNLGETLFPESRLSLLPLLLVAMLAARRISRLLRSEATL